MLDERPGVLREAAAAPTRARLEEGAPDPLVRADALDHVVDVGADRLAHRGDGVDERDLHRQESVGGVLDRLRRGRVGDQDQGVERGVDVGEPLAGGPVVGADDDPVGMQEVVDRRALAEELGVGHDGHVGPVEHLLDCTRRADRHRRLVDHERPGTQYVGDLCRGGLDVAQVGAAVWSCGVGTHRKTTSASTAARAAPTSNVSVRRRASRRRSRRARPRRSGSPRGASRSTRSVVDVGAHDLVAEVGEARRRGEPDVPGADHSDLGSLCSCRSACHERCEGTSAPCQDDVRAPRRDDARVPHRTRPRSATARRRADARRRRVPVRRHSTAPATAHRRRR